MDASECAAHVRISAIDFDAGVVGWLLNLLRATIKASLSKSMSQQVRPGDKLRALVTSSGAHACLK